jgi:hypothetical protein
VRRLDVRDPVADRLARRLLQRLRPEVDAAHLGAEELHALDVRLLPPHVFLAHVDDALEAEAGADRGRRDSVLPGARLGDDPPLAEPLREHRLPDRVVDLVRAGVVQILALEIDLLPRREALAQRERRRAPDVRRRELVQLGEERRILARLAPRAVELVERRDERLRDVAPAVAAEVTHSSPPRRTRAPARDP